MLNVKNARLRSEHDVNLLRNRLERLRQEERKALKKIEETRRRADQIVSLKTRNEENHMRKLLEAEFANQQLERARQRLQGHREGMQDAIRMNQQQLQDQKKSEAAELRAQSQRISSYVASQQQAHVERAKVINQVCSRLRTCTHHGHLPLPESSATARAPIARTSRALRWYWLVTRRVAGRPAGQRPATCVPHNAARQASSAKRREAAARRPLHALTLAALTRARVHAAVVCAR